VEETEYREVLESLDRALTQFADKPVDAGFDLNLYEEIRRARETLIRAQRDWRAKNAAGTPREGRP
jgi:hypothetical protein